jgi:multidrug resistance efflux pump
MHSPTTIVALDGLAAEEAELIRRIWAAVYRTPFATIEDACQVIAAATSEAAALFTALRHHTHQAATDAAAVHRLEVDLAHWHREADRARAAVNRAGTSRRCKRLAHHALAAAEDQIFDLRAALDELGNGD